MACLTRWYQVGLTSRARLEDFDIRQRVQASTPDQALRMVMREQKISFAHDASIWLLGRPCAPAVRKNVTCRVKK